MSKKQKSLTEELTESKNLKATLLEEFSAVPEKFFTFTHEGISAIWLHESTTNRIRGIRPRRS